MSGFWAGLVVGVFIGAALGFLTAALFRGSR